MSSGQSDRSTVEDLREAFGSAGARWRVWLGGQGPTSSGPLATLSGPPRGARTRDVLKSFL